MQTPMENHYKNAYLKQVQALLAKEEDWADSLVSLYTPKNPGGGVRLRTNRYKGLREDIDQHMGWMAGAYKDLDFGIFTFRQQQVIGNFVDVLIQRYPERKIFDNEDNGWYLREWREMRKLNVPLSEYPPDEVKQPRNLWWLIGWINPLNLEQDFYPRMSVLMEELLPSPWFHLCMSSDDAKTAVKNEEEEFEKFCFIVRMSSTHSWHLTLTFKGFKSTHYTIHNTLFFLYEINGSFVGDGEFDWKCFCFSDFIEKIGNYFRDELRLYDKAKDVKALFSDEYEGC